MQFHTLMLDFFTAISDYFSFLAEIFLKLLASFTEGTKNDAWTAQLSSNEGVNGSDIEFNAFEDEGMLNPPGRDSESDGWTTQFSQNENDNDDDTTFYDLEEYGYLNDLSKNLDGGHSTPQMMSNLKAEETESDWAASVDEDDNNRRVVEPFMYNLFEKQLYTDVTFHFNGSKEYLSAHRAVLAAKCEFFKDLLFGDQMKEAVGMEMQVQIKDVSFCTFADIVEYFYTDNIELADDSTVLEIYAAAESFQIQKLVALCKIYVESMELTVNNVCSTLEACYANHTDGLKSRCISYIERNTYLVIRSTDFEKCTFNTVHQICKLKNMNLKSEVEFLEALLHWIDVQQTSKETNKELTRCLLKCVRFLSFTPKELSSVIQNHADLLTAEEGLQILIYLNNPTPDNLKLLPNWCNKNPRSFQVYNKSIQKDVVQEHSDRRKIKISLKPTDEQRDISKLTALVHLRCIKGRQQITAIKFSFESKDDGGCLLANLDIRICISPNGPSFIKKYFVKSRQSTFLFKRAVTVLSGQRVQIEITATASESCKFLQFHRLHDDQSVGDFESFFTSIPKTGRLYFISEIEYAHLLPRLDAGGFMSPKNKEK